MKRFILLFIISLSLTQFIYSKQLSADYFLQEGRIKLNAGDIDAAIANYQQAINIKPNLDAAKFSLQDALNKKKLINFKKSFPEQCQKTIDFEQAFSCVEKYFIIDGEPVNPMIIHDLVPWLSDGGDQIVAINLLGSQHSNKYFYDNFELMKKEKYFFVSTVVKNRDFFSYEVKGITINNIIVLETVQWNLTGTGRFSNLLLVRIRKDVSLNDTISNNLALSRKRLLVEKLASYPLGDRVNSKISINGNTIKLDIKSINPAEDNKNTKSIMSIIIESQ